MKARLSLSLLAVLLLTAGVGCYRAKAKTDAQITSEVQSKFSQDSGLQKDNLGVQTDKGVVTLTGTVPDQGEREAAARQASSVEGVKMVVNNLEVARQQVENEPPPVDKKSDSRTHTTVSRKRSPSSRDREPEVTTRTSNPPPVDTTSTTTTTTTNTPPPPPPPPQKVTIPSGTSLAIRLVDSLDSETAQQGQTFHATLDSPLTVEGETAIPAGYDVEGHVVDVRSAGKFAGKSLLVLQLDRISANGKYYSIETDEYRREGSNRTTNTAKKVGAGAAIGAIIGGIAGGGKGAAIGAAAGGGLGGGVQAATKGQQIKLPTETQLSFKLNAPLTVVPTTQGPNARRQKLENN
jgi:hypothetical protein